jgi:glutaredoxin
MALTINTNPLLALPQTIGYPRHMIASLLANGFRMTKLARIIVFNILLAIAGNSAIAEAQVLNIQTSNSSASSIQILVASWCVHCRDLEKFLQDQNLGYIRLDIEKDPEGRKRYQQLGGGGVPMVIIGNSVLKGFDKEAILEMLEKSRMPPRVGQTI